MDLTRTPTQLADDAAEAVRSLCHVTINRDAYKEPAEINAAVSRIEALAYSLPQALQQTARTLQAMDEDPGIRIDSGADSAEKVAEAVLELEQAARALNAAGQALSQANQRLCTMGWHFSYVDDEDNEA
ncbi:hypothetical protein [Streptomyces sp. NPDC007074]|uniref:hypothetical protein n=1 Tax=Streptomyces sp. NPDC007074 TaxID=3156764 RepID=UPI0033D3A82A